MSRYTKRYLRTEKLSMGLPQPKDGKKYLLYVHIPFCTMFCPYCSFHKIIYNKDVAKAYFKSIRDEISHINSLGYDFDYMVIGGGTPLLETDEIIKTIELAKKLFSIKHVSCEADPSHIDAQTIARLKGLVERISIGVQTFDDVILQKLGRYEKYGSSKEIYDKVSAMLGILPITSVDLIFNFPTQTKESLSDDLSQLISLNPQQCSIYPLMTSPSVKNSVKKSLGEFSQASEYEFFELIRESLSPYFPVRRGWSFSKDEGYIIDEYVMDSDEYVGVGSGAFSFLGETLYQNEFDLGRYGEMVSQKGSGVVKEQNFSQKSQLYYRMMVSLFEGRLSKECFESRFGAEVKKALGYELTLLKLVGAVREDSESFVSSEFGEYLFLVLMKEFYMGMDRIRGEARRGLIF